ncbi:replication initiator [Leifsonia sp. NPDC102414]|uniref:replication initiator n=1 Tax=Leifsonia sp. NPDC102414 TaxID=3364124 RepID=UPI0038236576
MQPGPIVGCTRDSSIACGNRPASPCPSCARPYAGDTHHLIRAGITGDVNKGSLPNRPVCGPVAGRSLWRAICKQGGQEEARREFRVSRRQRRWARGLHGPCCHRQG